MRLLSIITAFLILSGAAPAATWYVPDDFPTIQDAVNGSANGDIVIVRPGVYLENIDFAGKDIVLRSEFGPDLTVIDGGFPANPDFGSGVIFENNEGPGSVLDGFTITNGRGRLSGNGYYQGGGIYCGGAVSPTIINNRIESNSANLGGGIYCDWGGNGSPSIMDNTITANTADEGGGVDCSAGGAPTIADNVITGNVSYQHTGGGLHCSQGFPVISNNLIADNVSLGKGGGGISIWYSTATLEDNIVKDNRAAGSGGGIYCVGDDPIAIADNTVTGNSSEEGGGMSFEINASPDVSGNTISANTALQNGGGIYCNHECSANITNNIIANNSAGFAGGAIATTHDVTLAGNTIHANTAAAKGGGIFIEYGTATVANSILWDNDAPQGKEAYLKYWPLNAAVLDISYSLLDGGRTSLYLEPACAVQAGPGMLDADPLFVDASGGDFRLRQDPPQPGLRNPCVDAGDPAATVIAGSTRTDGAQDSGTLDLGYHYPLGEVFYVPDDHPSIQDAIAAAEDGDIVVVRPGTYLENIDFLGKAVIVRSEQGPGSTVIDGQGLGSVATFESHEGEYSVIEGFTITNGTGRTFPGQGFAYGGGIYCASSSPTITNNWIELNSAYDGGGVYCYQSVARITFNTIAGNSADRGGGIFCLESSPVIEDNAIKDNPDGAGISGSNSSPTITRNAITGNDSGGIGLSYGSPVITGNVISENTDRSAGGGIFLRGIGSGIVSGNVISGNTASGDPYDWGDGGGLYISQCSLAITSNVISGNHAQIEGGGIYCTGQCDLDLVNNTITGNSAGGSGGGIFLHNSTLTVSNTILWDNGAPKGKEVHVAEYYYFPATLSIDHTCLDGGQWSVLVDPGCTVVWGEGMIKADPLFIDPLEEDYHLTFGSPCREAGSNTAAGIPPEDFEGDVRIAGLVADMGADEYHFHLYKRGDVVPGNPTGIGIVGGPGMTVRLFRSARFQEPPLLTPYGDLWLTLPPANLWSLQKIPSSGILVFPVTVPGSWLPGERYFFQALVGSWGAPTSMLTNMMELRVE